MLLGGDSITAGNVLMGLRIGRYPNSIRNVWVKIGWLKIQIQPSRRFYNNDEAIHQVLPHSDSPKRM